MPFKRDISNQYIGINQQLVIPGDNILQFLIEYNKHPNTHFEFRSNASKIHFETELNSELTKLFSFFNIDETNAIKFIQERINTLVNKNRHFMDINWHMFIYLNEFRKGEYALIPDPQGTHRYTYNEKGYIIDTYSIQLTNNELQNKTNIEKFIIENDLSDAIILKDNYIEKLSKNELYIYYEDTIYTPPLQYNSNKCICDIVNTILEKEGHTLKKALFPISLLEESTEIFMVHIHKGIQWVGFYKNIRFTNSISKRIFQQLEGYLQTNH